MRIQKFYTCIIKKIFLFSGEITPINFIYLINNKKTFKKIIILKIYIYYNNNNNCKNYK